MCLSSSSSHHLNILLTKRSEDMPLSEYRKGCWTCKERKVACDRRVPRCQTCLGSGRECKGYGMRLSWPRKDDKKRSMVAASRKQRKLRISLPPEFVNVFCSDVERLHDVLDPSVRFTRISVLPRLYQNPTWSPVSLARTEVDLLSYYENNVSPVLTAVNNPLVRNLVFRMSFSDATPAASAIIYTVFALASIHLTDRSRAQTYKKKAINAIWASATQSSTTDVLRRIVAVNLLAMFETLVTTETPPDWAADICFSKTASIATYALNQRHTGDFALVLDWVYYFDVLSKFSVRHFDRRKASALLCARNDHLMVAAMNSPDVTNIILTLGCSLEVWSAISSLLNAVLSMDARDGQHHAETLSRIERRLKYAEQKIKIEELDDDARSMDKVQQTRDIAELYRLAGLIYLHRAGHGTAISSPALQSVAESAFAILENLDTCERTFPLFITSCEARTDDQRVTVLRLLNTTRTRFAPTNIIRVHGYIERFWAADDLDVVDDTSYTERITAVLSSTDALPVFV